MIRRMIFYYNSTVNHPHIEKKEIRVDPKLWREFSRAEKTSGKCTYPDNFYNRQTFSHLLWYFEERTWYRLKGKWRGESGAMYPIVPLAIVIETTLWSFDHNSAVPKSDTFRLKFWSKNTLWGLMSKWRIHWSHPWWRYSIPLAIPRAISFIFSQPR